jgi:anti-sigma factor ChrR (cupin superfamily)
MQEVVAKASEVVWEAASGYPAGTQWKVLRRGSEGEPKTVLLKLAEGFDMPAHSHICVEHHYVISGGYDSQGERFSAGTYRVIPRHEDHGPFRSAQGAELLVMWED